MNPDQVVNDVVQKQATVGEIIADHMAGVGGYAIAEKYGIDPEKVKQILEQANEEGKFIPAGATPEPEASEQAVANAAKKAEAVGKTTTKDNV